MGWRLIPRGCYTSVTSDNDSAGAKIRRIGLGGAPVIDYGPRLYDPDGVLFDAVGAISGTPDSVLVARLASPPGVNGEISVITPDQNSFVRFTFVTPPGQFSNPNDLAFDGNGRFLATDSSPDVHGVLASTGGPLGVLFTLPIGAQPLGIAIDSANRIFTSRIRWNHSH